MSAHRLGLAIGLVLALSAWATARADKVSALAGAAVRAPADRLLPALVAAVLSAEQRPSRTERKGKMMWSLFTSLALLLFVPAAFADIGPVGDPVEGGSWSQRFDIGSNIDLFGIKIVTGSVNTLEPPVVLSGFEIRVDRYTYIVDLEWHQLMGTATKASAAGPARRDAGTMESLLIHFTGNKTDTSALTIQMFGFDGDLPVYGTQWTWWGGPAWSNIKDVKGKATRAEFIPVPAPGAIVLGMLGLGLVGWVKGRPA